MKRGKLSWEYESTKKRTDRCAESRTARKKWRRGAVPALKVIETYGQGASRPFVPGQLAWSVANKSTFQNLVDMGDC